MTNSQPSENTNLYTVTSQESGDGGNAEDGPSWLVLPADFFGASNPEQYTGYDWPPPMGGWFNLATEQGLDTSDTFILGSDQENYVPKIYGGLGDDTFTGGITDDLLVGGGGNDTFNGEDNDDTIYGDYANYPANTGNFALPTEADPSIFGNDILYGDDGGDTLYGGPGNDQLDGGKRGGGWTDVSTGGPGADVFLLSYDASNTAGGENTDSFWTAYGDAFIQGISQDYVINTIKTLSSEALTEALTELGSSMILGGISDALGPLLNLGFQYLFSMNKTPTPAKPEDVLVITDFDPSEDTLMLPIETGVTLDEEVAFFSNSAAKGVSGWGIKFNQGVSGKTYAEVFLSEDYLNRLGIADSDNPNTIDVIEQVLSTSLVVNPNGTENVDAVYPFEDSPELNFKAQSGTQVTAFGAFGAVTIVNPLKTNIQAGTSMGDYITVNKVAFRPEDLKQNLSELASSNFFINGFGGDDVLFGSAVQDIILGGDGNDEIYGIFTTLTSGGPLPEILYGGTGNDSIFVYESSANVDGGSGKDTLNFSYFDEGNSGITVDLSMGSFQSPNKKDNIYAFDNIEDVTGTDKNDTISGDVYDNILIGGSGDDILEGDGGIDTLTGNAGTDTFVFSSTETTLPYSALWTGSNDYSVVFHFDGQDLNKDGILSGRGTDNSVDDIKNELTAMKMEVLSGAGSVASYDFSQILQRSILLFNYDLEQRKVRAVEGSDVAVNNDPNQGINALMIGPGGQGNRYQDSFALYSNEISQSIQLALWPQGSTSGTTISSLDGLGNDLLRTNVEKIQQSVIWDPTNENGGSNPNNYSVVLNFEGYDTNGDGVLSGRGINNVYNDVGNELTGWTMDVFKEGTSVYTYNLNQQLQRSSFLFDYDISNGQVMLPNTSLSSADNLTTGFIVGSQSDTPSYDANGKSAFYNFFINGDGNLILRNKDDNSPPLAESTLTSDPFTYPSIYGGDTVTDFSAAENDIIKINGPAYGISRTSQINVKDDGSGNTLLSVASDGTPIARLLDIEASSFNASKSIQVLNRDRRVGAARDDGLASDLSANALKGKSGNKIFQVAAGEFITIRDFHGLGKGSQPTQNKLDLADTVQFISEDLSAKTMQLTQLGDDLQITFLGDTTDTRVLLQDFTLENFDNLLKATGANTDFDNVQFVGNALTDSIDVFDADSSQRRIWNRNSVTFLNDLNNQVKGFNHSDDVINGQGGDDLLMGLRGDDLLRGGEGDDTLRGGKGQDVLHGDAGRDIFVLGDGKGTDFIQDFEIGTDLIGLTDNLSLGQLTLSSDEIRFEDETLAVLKGVDTESLTETNFVHV